MIFLIRPGADHECCHGWCETCKSYDCKKPGGNPGGLLDLVGHNRLACMRCSFGPDAMVRMRDVFKRLTAP